MISHLNLANTRLDNRIVIILSAFLAVNAILLFSMPLLPFIDLPNHLAEAMVFKYYGEPGSDLGQFYKPVPWFFPNTFHAVFCSLFPSVELGNRVFHILYIALLQGALFLLIRRFNGNYWYGLLGLLLTYNYNTIYGFVGFMISIPMLLFLFYFILLDFSEDRIKWKFAITVTLLLLYSMHVQNALLGLLFYGLLLLIHHGKKVWKAVLTGLVVASPLIIMIFSWWTLKDDSGNEPVVDFLLAYYSGAFWTTYYERFYLFILDNYSLFDDYEGALIALFFFLVISLPLFYFRVWKQSLILLLWSGERRYLTMLFVAALACYFVLPSELPGQTPLYQRFCTMVMLCFVIVVSVVLKDVRWSRPMRIVSVAVVAMYMCFWTDYFLAFNRENHSFNEEFLRFEDKNARLIGAIWNKKFRGRNMYIHFPNYYVVWHKGISGTKIIDYRFGIVRRVAPEEELPFYHEYARLKNIDLMQYDNVDYFLAREYKDPVTAQYFPFLEVVKRSGDWVVYRNRNVAR